jgi:hypothetical protein
MGEEHQLCTALRGLAGCQAPVGCQERLGVCGMRFLPSRAMRQLPRKDTLQNVKSCTGRHGKCCSP